MPSSARSWVLTLASVVCVGGWFGCFFAGLWFQDRKYTESGVPDNHYPVQKGKRYYFVSESGGPVEQRMQYPISAGQFRAWQMNQVTGYILVAVSVLCLVGAVYLVAIAGRGRSAYGAERQSSEMAINSTSSYRL